MAERNDNGGAGWTERNITAPLNEMMEASKRDAVRDQVRFLAHALGLTVSEADADAHAATLLGLVAAENVSGVANHAVAAHLLDAKVSTHNAAIAARQEQNNALTERIAVALESLARGKGHDEPAQRVSGAVATFDIPAAYAAMKSGALVYAEGENGNVAIGTIRELHITLDFGQACVWSGRHLVVASLNKVRLATAEEGAR